MEELRDQLLEILCEFIYLFFILTLILFGNLEQNWTIYLELAILYSIMVGGILISLITISFTIISAYQLCQVAKTKINYRTYRKSSFRKRKIKASYKFGVIE